MEPRSTFPSVVGTLHLLIALIHGLSHQQLGIFGSSAQMAFILIVIYLVPAVSLARMRRHPRRAIGWLCAGLTGSFVFGSYVHFVAVSPDHVGHLPSTAWTLPFQLSAALLAFCDGAGALALAIILARHSYLLPGRRHIILVDGACIFCNRIVSTILRFDRRNTFHFAHLQGEFARDLVKRHGRDPNDVDPIYLLANAGTPEEKLLLDGEAGREVWPRVTQLAAVLRLVPLVFLNVSYALLARVRYRLIGKYDQCYVPSPAERARYLE